MLAAGFNYRGRFVMPAAAYPAHEAFRLATLADYKIIDTPNEPQFDRITRLAGLVMGTPISAISLVDQSRQWFKSVHGTDWQETSRDISFCAHGVDSGQPLLVSDAEQDGRFADNPLVTEGTIRSYFGAPLIAPNGMCLGMLCAITPEARPTPSEAQLAGLGDLAVLAMQEMLLHRADHALASASAQPEQAGHSLRMLTRLERALVARNEVFASFSHELRTPLQGILGFNELAQDSLEEKGDRQTYHAKIGLAGERMKQAIEGMLASLVRPDTWMMHEPAEIYVAPLIAETVHLLWSLAFKRQVTIASLGSADFKVAADREALRQTLMQLSINAIQACLPGGQVTLSVRPAQAGRVEVCIFNPGKALTNLECLQALTPLGQPCVAGGEGVGITLPIVKTFVEHSNGTIALHGSASPPGTIAVVTLVSAGLS
jgi:signal transduction histidine kinase